MRDVGVWHRAGSEFHGLGFKVEGLRHGWSGVELLRLGVLAQSRREKVLSAHAPTSLSFFCLGPSRALVPSLKALAKQAS